ncbi:hypothetical protein Salat_2621800 [Sesamum alatum]|uniref:Uncharacterized protein n=1 Tax=Sesamum alatum TaxID=300844 RepID=A0AAE2CAP4_9LAMI|nr:hypothetical protein Salat_2621800 [Sesamum alatum]
MLFGTPKVGCCFGGLFHRSLLNPLVVLFQPLGVPLLLVLFQASSSPYQSSGFRSSPYSFCYLFLGHFKLATAIELQFKQLNTFFRWQMSSSRFQPVGQSLFCPSNPNSRSALTSRSNKLGAIRSVKRVFKLALRKSGQVERAETSGSTITEGPSGSTFYLSGCSGNLKHLFVFIPPVGGLSGPADISSFGPGEKVSVF